MAVQLELLPSWRYFCGCGSAAVGYATGGPVYYLNHNYGFTSICQCSPCLSSWTGLSWLGHFHLFTPSEVLHMNDLVFF